MIRGWRGISVVLLASYKARTCFDPTPTRGYLSLLSDKADKSTPPTHHHHVFKSVKKKCLNGQIKADVLIRRLPRLKPATFQVTSGDAIILSPLRGQKPVRDGG